MSPTYEDVNKTLRSLTNTATERQADIDIHPSYVIGPDSDDENDFNSPDFLKFYKTRGPATVLITTCLATKNILRYGCDLEIRFLRYTTLAADGHLVFRERMLF